MLLLTEKHTDTFIEQTKAKPQETLQFVMKKQLKKFLFNPPLNLVQKIEWFLGVTSLECTNSVLNITIEKNSFSITISGHWNTKSAEKTIDELNKLSQLRL